MTSMDVNARWLDYFRNTVEDTQNTLTMHKIQYSLCFQGPRRAFPLKDMLDIDFQKSFYNKKKKIRMATHLLLWVQIGSVNWASFRSHTV
jgi:hypothetical protein